MYVALQRFSAPLAGETTRGRAACEMPVDCAALVRPTDWPPIRSPQAVHSALAELLQGTDVVEIGTRNGDGMRCFARGARSAVAIELNEQYCTVLQHHANNMSSAGLGGFRVHCQDYRRGTPDADYYTWWEQGPSLFNADVLRFLRAEARGGRIRPNASAILLFDNAHFRDVHSWRTIGAQAAWSRIVPFDERKLCLARARFKVNCRRARGNFTIAAFSLSNRGARGVWMPLQPQG